MKKNFMTRVLAVAMSAAMALSMATATNLTVAEAAAKPAMSSKSFTVRVGSAAKTYRATAATRKAYKIVKASAGNANKATAEIIKAGKAISVAAGTKTGKTTITLTFKNRTTGAKKTLKFAGKVVAAKKVASMTVAQKKADQLELTMGEALTEAPAASKITITREDNVSVSVKAVEIKKEDAKVLVVDTYTDMKDGKKYTVTLDTLSAEFTATDGVVADVALDKTEIPVNKLTEVKVLELDKNGIIVHEGGLTSTGDTRLTANVDTSDGYVQNDKLILYAAGNTAKVTITYAGTYDATGAYVGEVKKTVTVTAVAGLLSVDNFVMSVSATGKPAFDATSFKPVTAISVGDTTSKLWFCIKDNDGDEVKDYYNYKVSSSNSDVLILSEIALDDGVGITATPASTGSCYIVVKKDNAVVKTLPITVRDAKKVSSVSFAGQINTTIGTASYKPAESTLVFVKDQFGNPVTEALTYEYTVTGAPASATGAWTKDGASGVTVSNGVASVGTACTAVGNYTVEVVAKANANATTGFAKSNAKGYLTVTAKQLTNASATTTNGVFVYKPQIDSTITYLTPNADITNTVAPVTLQEGIATGVIADSNLKSVVVKNPAGVTIYKATYASGTATEVVTNPAITKGASQGTAASELTFTIVDETSGVFVKKLTKGTYTTQYTLANDKTITGTFQVVDNQEAPTFKIASSDAENASSTAWATNEDKVKFYFDGMQVEAANLSVPALAPDFTANIITNSNDTTKVKYVQVNAPITGTNGAKKVTTYAYTNVVLRNCAG